MGIHTAESETMRIWKARRNRSVRAHLAAIVVVVIVVFAGVGGVLGYATWQNSQQDAKAEAEYLADFAAGLLAESAGTAHDQAQSIAANPGVAPLLTDPASCTLDFKLLLFPNSHLDIVRSDGTIACSSADLAADGSTQVGASWLHATTAASVVSEIFTDAVTGEPAIAFVAPIEDDGRVIGSVAVVVPTAQIAQVVANTYGGTRNYDFALVDSVSRRVLSSSSPRASTAMDPMPGYLSASHPVAATTWLLIAGADPENVLQSTRSVLLRGALLGGCVLLVLMGSMLIVNRRIARPLRDLTRAVGGGGTRVVNALGSIEGPTEIEALAARFQTVFADRDAYEAQLSHQALHDPLTGLANRALLVERLNDALDRAAREHLRVVVLFIDLDRFKLINDSLGHDVGDTVLVEVARRVSQIIPAGATLARFGGDELVVAVEMSDDEQLQGLVDELLAGIVAPIQTSTAVVRVTGSIGIAISSVGRRAVDLIRDADNAMYAAKEAGRDRAERFTSRLHDRAAARLTLATEFRVALDRGQLHLVYQPKVELDTGKIVGVEALLRWDHPTLGSVPPVTFIPIAEETEAIIRVGEFVLEQACHQAMTWRRAGIELTMAVNISGRQLNDGGLPLQVATALALSGLPPELLYLELTETLLMTDTLVTQRSIERLHDLGARLSIDDFGTGYSSLAYLHRFPVDELKIDRAFVSDLTSAARPSPLVSAMVAMGKALGLEIVAEGVETPDQAAQLRALGCDKAQGYLFARPQHPDAIAALFDRVPIPI
ncbi:MAG: EAL domain-containing protein [Ilumatobacteraceae bacterium]